MANKTKFAVEIHHQGDANISLLRLVTNHNSGIVPVSLEMLMQVFYGRYAEFPNGTPMPHIEVLGLNGEELHFYEGAIPNRVHTLTIIEKREIEPVYEGEETMKDITPDDEHIHGDEAAEAPTSFLNIPNIKHAANGKEYN
jgi:hypothetical protein